MGEATTNIVVEISSDPNLAKSFFSKMEDGDYKFVEKEYREELKALRGLRAIKAGRLVSRVTSPEDYNEQLLLLSSMQGFLDRLHDIKMELLGYKTNWEELLDVATNYVNKKYHAELVVLKNEATRKAVYSAALQPLQRGLARIDRLVEMTDETIRHIDKTLWNIKEANHLIDEYLRPLKFPAKVV
jgi:hypothetical protein